MKKIGLLLILFLMASAPALAQESNETSDSMNTVTIDIDNSTRVVEYDLDHPNQSYIIIDSDYPRVVNIMDVNELLESDSDRISFNPTSVGAGETRINVDPETRGGDKTLWVMAGNRGAQVTNEASGSLIGDPNPFGFILGATGGGTAVFSLLYIFVRIKNYRYNKNPKEVF